MLCALYSKQAHLMCLRTPFGRKWPIFRVIGTTSAHDWGQVLTFHVIYHLQRACLSERHLLPVLKIPLRACREQYSMLRFRCE